MRAAESAPPVAEPSIDANPRPENRSAPLAARSGTVAGRRPRQPAREGNYAVEISDPAASRYQLHITEPSNATRVVELVAAVDVGRAADLTIADPAASRRHLRLEPRPEGVIIEDLGSTYGTKVNGWLMTHSVLLSPGDQVVLGDTTIVVAAPGSAPPGLPVADHGSSTIPPGVDAPVVALPPEQQATPAPIDHAAAARMASIDADGAATIRYVPGTAGERAAKGMATAVKRARRKLSGLGSEPWGTVPVISLVDPFPDPEEPSQVVTSGAVVDATRNEIWMVVTSEAPPEPPERSLALLFGASVPAAAELDALLEGYGLWLAKVPKQDEELRELPLPPLAAAEGELRSAMALSFVDYLIDRDKEDALRKVLGTAQPGRVDAALQETYGVGMTPLEIGWREKLETGGPKVKTGQFLRLSFRYLRPHKLRQAEIFVYMLFALAFTTAFPFVTRALFDSAIPQGQQLAESGQPGAFNETFRLLLILGVAFVISLLAGLRQAYLTAYISGAVVRDVRKEMFGKLQTLSTGWYHTHQQGDVLTRLFSDVQVVEQGLTQTLRDGLFQFLTLIVSSVVMLTVSPLLGIIVLVGAPLVAVVYRVMGKGAQKRGLAVQEETGALFGVAGENYSAEPVVKVFGLQEVEKARFGRISERLFRAERRLNLYGGIFGLSVNLIVTLLRLITLGIGAYLIINGQFTLGGLVAFLGIMGEVLSPVTVLTNIGQEIQQATGALYRINEVLDEEPELQVPDDAVALNPLGAEIRINEVSFAYNTERQVLDSVSAVIPAGARVAFVGPSGSGKSTLIALLMRLYDPDGGSVTFDGVDLRQATVESLRGQIGVVFQDNFLFDTTLRENISFGKIGATDAEIEAAARAAEMHDFIMELPRGYDTTVGERGGQLSGGQRQRMAIARALIRNPRLLLLDEATSALDPKTERQISATLETISHNRTTVAITHRLTSVTDYDHIFVIVDGELREQGTHDQLVAAGETYARLWAEQTGQAIPIATPAFDVVPALMRVPLFTELDATVLAELAKQMLSVDLAPGQSMSDGDGRMAIITSGRARVLSSGLSGERVVSAELAPGDAFGVNALLTGTKGSTLEATEATSLLMLDDNAISGLAARFPSVAARLDGDRVVHAVGPQSGTRLSRVTFVGKPNMFLDSRFSTPSALTVGEDVRRMTGLYSTPVPPSGQPTGSGSSGYTAPESVGQ